MTKGTPSMGRKRYINGRGFRKETDVYKLKDIVRTIIKNVSLIDEFKKLKSNEV